jgi:hypothetical protein
MDVLEEIPKNINLPDPRPKKYPYKNPMWGIPQQQQQRPRSTPEPTKTTGRVWDAGKFERKTHQSKLSTNPFSGA